VPAKGEPHFRMGELISKLNVIKDDPKELGFDYGVYGDYDECHDENVDEYCNNNHIVQPRGSLKN